MSKYEIKYTTQFKKDYKLAKRRGLDITLLKDIVSSIRNEEKTINMVIKECIQLDSDINCSAQEYIILLVDSLFCFLISS